MIWLHGIAQANWQCHLYGVPLIDATDLQTATTRNVHEQWQWQYNRDAIRDRNRRCRAHWGDRGLDISIMDLLCRRLPVFVAVDAVVGLAICSDFVYYYFFVLLPSTSLSVPSFSSRVFFSILPAKSISITCESWCVPSSASIHSHRRLIEWSRMRFTFRRKHTHTQICAVASNNESGNGTTA